MKERIPYFDFYPTDFMRGVRGLTAQEVGVYTMLLCRIYEESGPIEMHAVRLAAYCGMRVPSFTKALDRLIELDKFSLSENMLDNERSRVEISKRAHKLNVAKKAGVASGEKRQQNQQMEATDVQRASNHTDKSKVKEEAAVAAAREGGNSEPDPTARERLLAAMGADPRSGMIGPNGKILGTTLDTAEAGKWAGMGILLDAQCAVIAERCAAMRRTNANWVPSRFSYFTGAMADLAAARDRPLSQAGGQSDMDEKRARWKRLAGEKSA